MKEIEKAKALLIDDVTFAALGKRDEYISKKRGVAPIIELIDTDPEFLEGAAVADRVIGKAAAMLLEKHGAAEIFAQVTSEHAFEYLSDKAVKFEYNKKVEYIINRDKTDMCPMEKAVLGTNDADEGERLIREKIKNLTRRR